MRQNPTSRQVGDTDRDRRIHPRQLLSTTASVRASPRRLWCHNLSLGGMLLTGAPQLPRRSCFGLELHLPWSPPVAASARVVYSDRLRGDLVAHGVEFLDLSAPGRMALRQVLIASRHPQRPREAVPLAITEGATTSSRLERDFGLIGTSGLIINDPLEALRWLHDWVARVDCVLADLDVGEEIVPLLFHLARSYPAIRRVAIVGRGARLAELTSEPGLFHDVVEDPWSCHELERALDAPRGNVTRLSRSR